MTIIREVASERLDDRVRARLRQFRATPLSDEIGPMPLLRALEEVVAHHKPVADSRTAGTVCMQCEWPWPCPDITNIATELGVIEPEPEDIP